jgi:hypothetical protein
MIGKTSLTLAAALVALGVMSPIARAEQSGVKAGVLTCNVDSGWGFVFGSTREVKCTYSHRSGTAEHYVGHIRKFGVDIGYISGGVVAWAVLAPTADVGKGAIAGDYGGVTGGATVAVGAGANVLVGGFNKSITLQPVSFEGNAGLNVAAGIAQMSLDYQAE